MSAQQPPEKLGKYKIVRELGKGAMGVVYEGIDPIIGRRVAIKTARRDVMEASGRADEMMQRFLREARAAGMLNDPGIITIYDADEENGIAYIAMEFIDSGNLQDYLAHRGRPSPEEAVEIGAQICKALALAHAQGIVHRDIKPANIMMLSDGTVKIADFGIAHVSDSNLTQEGAMIGTPHYMSPEQFMGHKIDGRSDLFSVALIVYEMLTGEKPF
ncbi:MAG TPA: serine/threonine-protein kinase, partial [Candidatus Hydrogenedentes bacterium]|nr:serine/threonine-protein kinase [Candidatus Hydrogenedentota bacterium]